MNKGRRRRIRRAGYALVLMVMLLFGIFGFAALVIDLGFARLTQRQMQTAVDAAALEGLRWRDVQLWEQLPQTWLASPDFQAQVGVGANPTDPMTPQQRDAVRRWAASQAVGQLFDDNLNAGDDGPGTGDPGGIYGAGPVVQIQRDNNGSALPTSQLILAPTTPVYKPVRSDGVAGLELNAANNASSGDLVAGSYGPNASYSPPSGGSANPADEDANYNRRDFQSASASAGPAASSFLARMRRTNNLNSLDTSAGVSSSGPPLPILFGSGSMMARSGGSGQLSVASGITARATAIAAAAPAVAGLSASPYTPGLAKTVGPSYWISTGVNGAAPTMLPGVTPFAIRSDLWSQLSAASAGSGKPVTVDLSKGDPRVVVLTPTLDPYYSQVYNGAANHYVASLTAIGQPVQGESSFDDSALSQAAGSASYVPIFADLPSQPSTIIGFGYYVQWTYQKPALTLNAASATAPVGSQNVSGVMALPLPAALTTQDQGTLFQLHDALVNPLYAPVLVDHFIGPNAVGGN
jgi:hypothetical protein